MNGVVNLLFASISECANRSCLRASNTSTRPRGKRLGLGTMKGDAGRREGTVSRREGNVNTSDRDLNGGKSNPNCKRCNTKPNPNPEEEG